MIVEQQSFLVDIRDAMYNVVTADSYFATGWTFRKTKMKPVQADLIPYLGVYVVSETMVPDGDIIQVRRFNYTGRISYLY